MQVLVAYDVSTTTPQTVGVVLNNCIDFPQTFSTCSGTWLGVQGRDGFDFTNSVTVTKTVVAQPQPRLQTRSHANVTYAISATVAPSWNPNPQPSLNVNLGQIGVLTDTISVTGEKFQVTNSNPRLSYVPTLTLGPAGPR